MEPSNIHRTEGHNVNLPENSLQNYKKYAIKHNYST